MRYGLGVDLGTATVGAAVLGPEGVEPVVLGERSVVLPAVVHVTPDGKFTATVLPTVIESGGHPVLQ